MNDTYMHMHIRTHTHARTHIHICVHTYMHIPVKTSIYKALTPNVSLKCSN